MNCHDIEKLMIETCTKHFIKIKINNKNNFYKCLNTDNNNCNLTNDNNYCNLNTNNNYCNLNNDNNYCNLNNDNNCSKLIYWYIEKCDLPNK
jgi:hypothetical protein